ncbi:MAG: CHAT domain-containing protein [Myxococcota bacterium]
MSRLQVPKRCRWLGLVALTCGLIACDEPESSSRRRTWETLVERRSEARPLRCTTIDDDGVCEIVVSPDASEGDVHGLDVWIEGDTTEGEWDLARGGGSVGAVSALVAGGTHHDLGVPVSTARVGSMEILELRVGSEIRWSGEIRWTAGSTAVAAWRAEAKALGFDPAEHGTLADRVEAGLGGLAESEQVAALELLRKLRSRQAGRSAERRLALVRPVIQRLIPLAAKLERWSALCTAVSIDIWLGYQSFAEEASPVLHEDWRARCNDRAPHAMFDYYSGVDALRRGRYGHAESRLRAVIARAAQTRDPHLAPAERRLAEVMALSGRWGEMERIMSTLPEPTDDCDAFRRWSDEGYFRLLAAEYGGLDLGDPTAVLQRAVASPCGSAQPVERAHLQIKLAHAALVDGNLERARTHLEELDAEVIATTKYETQRRELLARLALSQGRHDEAFEHASAARATAARRIPERQWAVQVLLARIEHARGHEAEAEAAYREAEAQLDQLAEGSAGTRLDRIAYMHRAAVDGLAALLVEQGRVEDALCALRRANRRPMMRHAFGSSPGDLGASCEQGATLAAGEVWLAFTPIGGELWALTLDADGRAEATSTGVRVPLASADPGVVDALVQPVAAPLAVAERVRILPTPAVLDLDLHRGRIDGKPLIARLPVSYSLDLPAVARPRGEQAPRGLLAFANVDRLRRLDLWAEHVSELDATLRRSGWAVTRAETPQQLARGPLESSLAGLDLFYYFGHGAQISAMGGEGSEPVARIEGPRRALATTALDLGEGGYLGPHEVLALPSVPRHVLLVGCELANPDLLSSTGGLNLVQALLLAGSADVVAAPTDIGSGVGASFGPAMVQQMAENGLDAAQALHLIWREARDRGRSEPPWYEFRVWSR